MKKIKTFIKNIRFLFEKDLRELRTFKVSESDLYIKIPEKMSNNKIIFSSDDISKLKVSKRKGKSLLSFAIKNLNSFPRNKSI